MKKKTPKQKHGNVNTLVSNNNPLTLEHTDAVKLGGQPGGRYGEMKKGHMDICLIFV